MISELYNWDGDKIATETVGNENVYRTVDNSKRLTKIVYGGTQIEFQYKQGSTNPMKISRTDNGYINEIKQGYDGDLLDNIEVVSGDSEETDTDAIFQYNYQNNFALSKMVGVIFESLWETDILSNQIGETLQFDSFKFSQNKGTIEISDDNMDCVYVNDLHGLLTTHTCSVMGKQIFKHILSRDINSTTIASRQVKVEGGLDSGYSYSYDPDGQLETVSKDDALSETYMYDVNGNRVSWSVNSQHHTATYDDSDRLKSFDGEAYQYDENGFLKEKTGKQKYQYNAKGELEKSSNSKGETSYRYEKFKY